MRKGNKENQQRSVDSDVTKGIEDLEKSVNEMMSYLQGNSDDTAKELFEELQIDKLTLEAIKELEGDIKLDLYRELKDSVQGKLKKYNENLKRFDSNLEGKIGELENTIADLTKKLEQVDDKNAKNLLKELERFGAKIKEIKSKKLDAKVIDELDRQISIFQPRVESFLKKNAEVVPQTAQQKYDAKITTIEYYLRSILQNYNNQNVAKNDPRMITYIKMKDNFDMLKKQHKRGDALNKFEALEEGLKLIAQDIRSPGILKQQVGNKTEGGSEKTLNKIPASKLSADARLAFNSLTTFANKKHLVIDKDALHLRRKINEIRRCIESNATGKKEPTGDIKTALGELKELENRLIKAEKTVILFKKVAQNKVLKQMEKIVTKQKAVFENAISNRAAPISPPVPPRPTKK